MALAFHAQYGEDRWLWDHAAALGLPMRGVYVDVGASDGVNLSNTKWLEDMGWRGLCIEPHPSSYKALAFNRDCHKQNRAIARTSGTFYVKPIADHSGILRTDGEPHPVMFCALDRTMQDAGIDPRAVDLMSVDTEGTELDVWASRPSDCLPRIVVMEHNTIGLPPQREQIAHQLITRDGYRLLHETPVNLVFGR